MHCHFHHLPKQFPAYLEEIHLLLPWRIKTSASHGRTPATLAFSGSGGGGGSGTDVVESEAGVVSAAGTFSPVLGLDVDDGEASDEAAVPDFLRSIFSLRPPCPPLPDWETG
jgi:hypothetical protein